MGQLNTIPQKHPFTLAGCRALQKEWANMCRAELWAEAKSIQANFKQWLCLHFRFTAQQVQHLMALNLKARSGRQQVLAARLQALQAQLHCKVLCTIVLVTQP